MPGGRHDARRDMTPRAMMPGAHGFDRARRPQFGWEHVLVMEHECCACVNDHPFAHLALEPAWGGGEIGTFWHVPRMVLSWSMHADVGMLGCRVAAVGCPKPVGSPSEGFAGRIE